MLIVVSAALPGPAKYLTALNPFESFERIFVGGEHTVNIFKMISNKVIDGNVAEPLLEKQVNQIRLIITGTELGMGLDKELVNFALRNRISCVSIVDHWTWMRQRFFINDTAVLPNHIIVNDHEAKKRCVLSGVPSSRINVLGNPILEECNAEGLAFQKAQKFSPDYPHQRERSPSGRKILFISEDKAAFYENEIKRDFGYTEFECLNLIMSKCSKDDVVHVKLHPTESDTKYVNMENFSILREPLTHVEVAKSYDLIVGMESIYLLELAMFRDDIISLRPTSSTPFIGCLLNGVIQGIGLPPKGVVWRVDRTKYDSFLCSFKSSKARINGFLEGLIR